MFTSKTLLALILTTALGFVAGSANAAIINITPSKDNTLYQYDPVDGDTSNALGLHFFAGKTAMGELRRGCAGIRYRWKYSSRLDDNSR